MGGVEQPPLPEMGADELCPDGQPLSVKAAGHGQRRQSRQVHRHGVDVAEVHFQRVAQAVPQHGGGGGGHRGEQQITPGKCLVKGALDDCLHLEGFFVISVVVAGREYKGAQQDAPLDFHAEALSAGFVVQVSEVLVPLRPPLIK